MQKRGTMKTFKIALVFILSAVTLLTACQNETTYLQIVGVPPVKSALKDIISAFREEEKGKKIRIRALYERPVDIYNDVNGGNSGANIVIMINSNWFTNLATANKLSNVEKFGKDVLVLVGSVHAQDSIESPSELVPLFANRYLGISDPIGNVLGQFSLEILKYYKIYDNLKDKLRYFSDASTVLQATEISQIDYSILYHTEFISSDHVKIVYTFPQESHTPVIYSMGIVSYNYDDISKKFIDYVHSKRAQDILKSYGFQ